MVTNIPSVTIQTFICATCAQNGPTCFQLGQGQADSSFPLPDVETEIISVCDMWQGTCFTARVPNSTQMNDRIFLLDGQILKAMKLIELDPEAVQLFHATIRKQLDMDYNRIDFDRYLAGLHNYDTQDLLRMGKVFKQTLRSDSSTRNLFLFLCRWL